MKLPEGLLPDFSHIYVEREIWNDPETERICSFFPRAHKIPSGRYTDVFDRMHQSHSLQHASKSLILASAHGKLLYEGSPVCQNFDERWFYYCTPVMNCLYDCEYCWLKGMYPSGNPVVFINQDDIMRACEDMLKEHPVYLCISYDTDLLALEPLLGHGQKWAEFTVRHPDLTIEIRTKAASVNEWKNIPVNDRVIFAFTLSPEEVWKQYEHGTPSLSLRLNAACQCLEEGRPVRLCFDPMIPVHEWKKAYAGMMDQVQEKIDLSLVRDVSVGTFRISTDYLKKMRKTEPESGVVQYPYEAENGFYRLPFGLNKEMEEYMISLLKPYVQTERIFTWEK